MREWGLEKARRWREFLEDFFPKKVTCKLVIKMRDKPGGGDTRL